MRRSLFVSAIALCIAGETRAQWGLWPADSLLAEGRLASAESVYYAAVRQHPRDPLARAALGRFLAARGGIKAGAVLLEEAQFFGGDSAALARSLVPLYIRLGNYEALAALRPRVLSPAERRRAEWMSSRRQEARLRDTIVLLTYRPIGDGRGIGTVILRVGKAELPAVIDPRVTGLILPAAVRRDVRSFGVEDGRTVAVVEQLRVGPVTFANVPVTVGNPDESARLGFDIIAPYYPSFDPGKGLMALRRVDRRAPPLQGPRIPGLYDTNGLRLLVGSRWLPVTASAPAMLLATRRWIWDWKMGDVVLIGDR